MEDARQAAITAYLEGFERTCRAASKVAHPDALESARAAPIQTGAPVGRRRLRARATVRDKNVWNQRSWADQRSRLLPGDRVQLKGVMTVDANHDVLVRCAHVRGSRARLFLMPANFLNVVDGHRPQAVTEFNSEDSNSNGKQEEQKQHMIDFCTQ